MIIQRIREEVDDLDSQIIELINCRIHLVGKIDKHGGPNEVSRVSDVIYRYKEGIISGRGWEIAEAIMGGNQDYL